MHFASGTSIRQSLQLEDQDWQNVVPSQIKHLYHSNIVTTERTFNYLKYALLTQSPSSLQNIYTMSEGLEHRLKDLILPATSFESYMQLIKTKRYTYTHLQRVLMNVLLDYTYDDIPTQIDSVRILE